LGIVFSAVLFKR